MNTLLIFFALPLATIILAIVLQKLIKCPVLVAAIFFAIYLIVAFAVFDATFLIVAIVYTFLAYVTASIVRIICCFIRNCNWNCDENNYICNRSISTNDTVILNNTNAFNNGYNRGYNRGYYNASDNAMISNNVATTNNGCGCSRRNRRR